MSIIDVIQEKTPQMGVLITASDLEAFASHVASATVAAMNTDATSTRKDESNELLSDSEVRRILEVSPATLWRWRKRGYLTGVPVGGRIKYRRDEVIKILNGERR